MHLLQSTSCVNITAKCTQSGAKSAMSYIGKQMNMILAMVDYMVYCMYCGISEMKCQVSVSKRYPRPN